MSDHAFEPAPRRLAALPSWLASQVALRGHRLVGEALAEEGMRRPHFALLVALDERGSSSQADLGRSLWIDRSDLHAIVTELEARGLVARVRDERDRRRNLVDLTPAGRETLARLSARVDSAQEALLRPLTAPEREKLLRLLRRLLVDPDSTA